MTPETYRWLHLVGVLMLFVGLGGILAQAGDGKGSRLFLALHGIGLVAMLVCGIGYIHKKPLAWENWVFAKIACWVLLGAVPVLVRRGVLPRALALILVIGLGGAAAWLAQAKPF